MQPLPKPQFVTIGAKVGSKVVSVRRKWFVFFRELLKIAIVSDWSSMKWFILKFVENLCWADV